MELLKTVYLHTGTNLGNRLDNLMKVNQLIENHIGTITQLSSIYETAAWGVEDQPDFLNQALLVKTNLTPLEILEQIYQIEQTEFKRVRAERWAERVIDIDILFYEQEIWDTPKLTLPHPQIPFRNFVLIPLMEIAPYFEHPILKDSIENLYLRSEDTLEVILTEYQTASVGQ